jgi:hypothetical protein
MSPVYPERKSIKERRDDKEKQKVNRVKQMSILIRVMRKRKPNIGGSGEKENATQRKIHKTD